MNQSSKQILSPTWSSLTTNYKLIEKSKQLILNQIKEKKESRLILEQQVLNKLEEIQKIKIKNESIKSLEENKKNGNPSFKIESIEKKLNECHQIKVKIENIEKEIKLMKYLNININLVKKIFY